MASPPLLDDETIAAALQQLSGWSQGANGIEKGFTFGNFAEAFAFMTRVAFLAEAHNHHPEWSNVWNKVHIRLSTHESGGLTQRDLDLATAVEEVLQS